MTPNKGWGVRCREPLTPGAFVCCYIGEVVTESMVKLLAAKEEDHYLFTLDFFLHLFKVCAEGHGLGIHAPLAVLCFKGKLLFIFPVLAPCASPAMRWQIAHYLPCLGTYFSLLKVGA